MHLKNDREFCVRTMYINLERHRFLTKHMYSHYYGKLGSYFRASPWALFFALLSLKFLTQVITDRVHRQCVFDFVFIDFVYYFIFLKLEPWEISGPELLNLPGWIDVFVYSATVSLLVLKLFILLEENIQGQIKKDISFDE